MYKRQAQAEQLEEMNAQLAVLEQAMQPLVGTAEVYCLGAIDQTIKRQRRVRKSILKTSPNVAAAFSRYQREERERDASSRMALEEVNAMQKAKATANREWKESQLRLKKNKEELFDVQAIEDFKNTDLMAPLGHYGYGLKNCGTRKVHRARRLGVLDRARALAPALTSQEMVDFGILKAAWDDWGVKTYRDEWADVFHRKIQTCLLYTSPSPRD